MGKIIEKSIGHIQIDHLIRNNAPRYLYDDPIGAILKPVGKEEN
jgi:hypothetical protein